jgi:hypothetical protein
MAEKGKKREPFDFLFLLLQGDLFMHLLIVDDHRGLYRERGDVRGNFPPQIFLFICVVACWSVEHCSPLFSHLLSLSSFFLLSLSFPFTSRSSKLSTQAFVRPDGLSDIRNSGPSFSF